MRWSMPKILYCVSLSVSTSSRGNIPRPLSQKSISNLPSDATFVSGRSGFAAPTTSTLPPTGIRRNPPLPPRRSPRIRSRTTSPWVSEGSEIVGVNMPLLKPPTREARNEMSFAGSSSRKRRLVQSRNAFWRESRSGSTVEMPSLCSPGAMFQESTTR